MPSPRIQGFSRTSDKTKRRRRERSSRPPRRENSLVRRRDFKTNDTLGPDSTLSRPAVTGVRGGDGKDRNEGISGFARLAGIYKEEQNNTLHKEVAADVKRRFPQRRAAGSGAPFGFGNRKSRDR